MTIVHHPADHLLEAYATGSLAGAHRVAIATHLFACAKCRAWVSEIEHIGGGELERLEPNNLAGNARAQVFARIEQIKFAAPDTSQSLADDALPNLPLLLRRQVVGRWRRVAPGLRLQPIAGTDASDARVFLLKGRPGTRLLAHSHRGLEMSCVLSGGFTHGGGHFGPGDFDIGDEECTHRVTVDPGGDCVALVVLEGKLRLTGFLGRLVEPFLPL